jgi:translin
MNLEEMGRGFAERFDAKMKAREQALAEARRSIRSSANAIRAIHRGDFDRAHALMEESREAVRGGMEACRDHPDVAFAGYLQDAQKEYSEARLTEAAVTGADLPGPDELGVQLAPYLNGLAETVGEIRRHILDLLRAGEVEESERLLGAMDDIYSLLVTIDYPDAITGNLRRSTDVARSIMEKTRGDLSLALVQRDLRDALDRHARDVLGKG